MKSKWIEMLGRSSEDRELLALLNQSSVQSVPVIAKNRTTSRLELRDAMLVFSAGELYPDLAGGGDGTSVLSSVLLPLKNRKWGEYTGDLPLELTRGDSQASLRARFGEPQEAEEEFRWDEWQVGDRLVRAHYSEDLQELEALGIALPHPA